MSHFKAAYLEQIAEAMGRINGVYCPFGCPAVPYNQLLFPSFLFSHSQALAFVPS